MLLHSNSKRSGILFGISFTNVLISTPDFKIRLILDNLPGTPLHVRNISSRSSLPIDISLKYFQLRQSQIQLKEMATYQSFPLAQVKYWDQQILKFEIVYTKRQHIYNYISILLRFSRQIF